MKTSAHEKNFLLVECAIDLGVLEVDIAEPLCVKRRPTDEEGDDDGGQQQKHTSLVALLSRALTIIIMSNIIQNILKKKNHLKAVGAST